MDDFDQTPTTSDVVTQLHMVNGHVESMEYDYGRSGITASFCQTLHPTPVSVSPVALSPPPTLKSNLKRDRCRAWETRKSDWRRLRHDRALMNFHRDLNAPNFTNPPQRVALFREFKEGQVRRHGQRVALLRDLCGLRPVDVAPGVVADQEQVSDCCTIHILNIWDVCAPA